MDRDEMRDVMRVVPALKTVRDRDGEVRQTEIRRSIDRSKSTTHRWMKKAESLGLVSKDSSGYALTDLGEVAIERTTEYVRQMERAEEYEEFLCVVSETDLRLTDISDADVTRSSPTNPVAPLVRLAEVTVNASEVRVLTNSIAPEGFEVGRERIRSGEQEVEMVVDRRTVDSIRGSDWFGDELERDLRTGNFDLWVHEDDVPYQMGIMDDTLCLGAEDEDRMPVAMLETENEYALDWALSVFEEYREEATRLEADDV